MNKNTAEAKLYRVRSKKVKGVKALRKEYIGKIQVLSYPRDKKVMNNVFRGRGK